MTKNKGNLNGAARREEIMEARIKKARAAAKAAKEAKNAKRKLSKVLAREGEPSPL